MSFPLLFGDPEADRYLKLRHRGELQCRFHAQCVRESVAYPERRLRLLVLLLSGKRTTRSPNQHQTTSKSLFRILSNELFSERESKITLQAIS